MTDEIRAPRREISPAGRVATSFTERRWVTFLAELVLIVAGILIALYIDGRVQERQDRDLETAYLGSLYDDLGQIENEVTQFVEFDQSILATGKKLLDAIATENLPGDERVMQAMLSELTVRRTLQIHSAAYTDLVSTGNLRLIRNQELRRDIVRYFAATERAELILEKNSRAFIDEIYVRFVMDAGITIGVDESTLGAVGAANDILMDHHGPDFVWPRNESLSMPPRSGSWDGIRRQVLFRMRVASTAPVLGNEVIDATQRLKADIENELARRIR